MQLLGLFECLPGLAGGRFMKQKAGKPLSRKVADGYCSVAEHCGLLMVVCTCAHIEVLDLQASHRGHHSTLAPLWRWTSPHSCIACLAD
jgi:hypothetical protein